MQTMLFVRSWKFDKRAICENKCLVMNLGWWTMSKRFRSWTVPSLTRKGDKEIRGDVTWQARFVYESNFLKGRKHFYNTVLTDAAAEKAQKKDKMKDSKSFRVCSQISNDDQEYRSGFKFIFMSQWWNRCAMERRTIILNNESQLPWETDDVYVWLKEMLMQRSEKVAYSSITLKRDGKCRHIGFCMVRPYAPYWVNLAVNLCECYPQILPSRYAPYILSTK